MMPARIIIAGIFLLYYAEPYTAHSAFVENLRNPYLVE
jgi:hypothetical protein